MYKKYKIKAWVPAGRRLTMDILFKYFVKHSDIIDEVMICENTLDLEDIKYMRTIAEVNPLFKLYRVPSHYNFIQSPVQLNTRTFYEYMQDEDTIYIRFDDDIIYIDDDYLKNLLKFRLAKKNAEYFLVFGHIVNNAMCGYLEQQAGVFPYELFQIDSGYCMNMRTWGSWQYAKYVHELLLEKIEKGRVEDFYVPHKELDKERFSISNFCFFGRDMKAIGKIPILDEEIFVTEEYPKATGKKNVICGNALVSHYTFSPYQKPEIIKTNILQRYQKVAEDKLSRDYYKLLNG